MKNWIKSTDSLTEALKKEILNSTEKIMESDIFRNSERMKSLLKYLINHNLENPEAYLSSYQIAQDVFDRGDDFDPSVDPILRVQMSRMRIALERYYTQNDNDLELKIEIPKGQYKFEIYKPETIQSDTKQSSKTKEKLSPLRIWLEPLEDLKLTNLIANTLKNNSIFNVCGLRKIEQKYTDQCDLVLCPSLSVDQTHFKLDILRPSDLCLLSSDEFPINSEHKTESILSILIDNYCGAMSIPTQICRNYRLISWVTTLYDLFMNESFADNIESLEKTLELFKFGNRIENQDPSIIAVYLGTSIFQKSLLDYSCQEEKQLLNLSKDMLSRHPKSIRFQVLNHIIQDTNDENWDQNIMHHAPLDLVEIYASYQIRKKNWSIYWELVTVSIHDPSNQVSSYFDSFGIFDYLLQGNKSKAKELLDSSYKDNGFYLKDILRVILLDKKSSDYASSLSRIQSISDGSEIENQPLLNAYFHQDDIKSIIEMLVKKTKK
ncbi:hypothetical protein [Aureibacter tunicatorum]|uniref:Uncharacterized protein n=1 Tax=Aureibacter tunicatorum TaxID=866807 RepID=A0AAE3XP22_9BACT|nr:hypothetical protein [Aureibacter tunicatorum]MDR6238639.1 hypothetical protein [Aureibacter tunicatorum]BDD05430.1 hypothetical protein AUTU_29130 [Aureibacter tunicatorum]